MSGLEVLALLVLVNLAYVALPKWVPGFLTITEVREAVMGGKRVPGLICEVTTEGRRFVIEASFHDRFYRRHWLKALRENPDFRLVKARRCWFIEIEGPPMSAVPKDPAPGASPPC